MVNGGKRVLDSDLTHQGNDQLTPLEKSIIGAGLYDLVKYIQGYICKVVADVYNSVDSESTSGRWCVHWARGEHGAGRRACLSRRGSWWPVQAVEVAGGRGFGHGVAMEGGDGV